MNNSESVSSPDFVDLLPAPLTEVTIETIHCLTKWPSFNSAHEGFAILKEEVDELWTEVKINQRKRDIEKMKREAVQVAAMALRFIIDVCNEETGRK